MSNLKLVLIRHAARANGLISDPRLSAIGTAQAESLAHAVSLSRKLPTPTHLFASPKTRARETLLPISRNTGLPLLIDARLDERLHEESQRLFETRVAHGLEALTQLPAGACAYVCSHLDWLEVALGVLSHDLSDDIDPANWSNCEYRVFELVDDLWVCRSSGVISAQTK